MVAAPQVGRSGFVPLGVGLLAHACAEVAVALATEQTADEHSFVVVIQVEAAGIATAARFFRCAPTDRAASALQLEQPVVLLPVSTQECCVELLLCRTLPARLSRYRHGTCPAREARL